MLGCADEFLLVSDRAQIKLPDAAVTNDRGAFIGARLPGNGCQVDVLNVLAMSMVHELQRRQYIIDWPAGLLSHLLHQAIHFFSRLVIGGDG